MGLIDKLNSSHSTSIQRGKTIKSDGQGGFGPGSANRHSSVPNSFNDKNGLNHFSRAKNGNIAPNGMADTNTHFSDDDVEFEGG